MKKSLFAVCASALALTSGCGPTVAEIMEMHNQDLIAGKFEQSMPLMQELIADDKENTHEDTPMWRLMVANAKMITGDEKAIEEFDAAETVVLANDKKAKNYFSSMLVNEKYFAFEPSFQERMFVSIDKAVMYAAKGKNDEARSEFNRMATYQEKWLNERKKEIAASEAAIAESLKPAAADEKSKMPAVVVEQINKLKVEAANVYQKLLNSDNILGLVLKHCNYDLKNSTDIAKLKPTDYQNAYATHFCGVFRWLNKDDGAAYLKDAAKLKPASKVITSDFAAADKSVMPENEVWVYVEDGLCPVREESRIDLPIMIVPFLGNYVKYFGMALPKMVLRGEAAKKYVVAGVEMEELESIDRLVKTEYNVYMNGAVKRELLRALLKTLPQVAAGVVKDTIGDPQIKLACSAAQYAAAGYALASTQADLRSWNVLPKRVMVQRVKRPADGVIKLTADNQNIDITVPAGNTIVWVRKVAAASPFVVRQINFAAQK